MSSLTLPLRVFEYWVMQYRRVWRGTAITSIINPVFYLGALGVGLGTLVNQSSSNSLGVPYIDYVAPGMLAATAMTIASGEASWPVMGSIKWTRQYFAMLATPIGTRDIVLGHQLWMTTRVASTSAVYLVVIAAFGRAVSEVGAVMVVGGNIDGFTRVMTTAIALETSKGDLPLALALGIVLLGVVLLLNLAISALRGWRERVDGGVVDAAPAGRVAV